jgi:hypothetical protein
VHRDIPLIQIGLGDFVGKPAIPDFELRLLRSADFAANLGPRVPTGLADFMSLARRFV